MGGVIVRDVPGIGSIRLVLSGVAIGGENEGGGSRAASTAGAAPTATDLALLVHIPRGKISSTQVRPNFSLAVVVESTRGADEVVTVRIGLPSGLHWGTNGPDASEGCAGDSPSVCSRKLAVSQGGGFSAHWDWSVVATQPGNYEITATVEGEQEDPDTSNNTSTVRFEVVAGGVSGGGGSGSSAAKASAVKLSPTKPKAGSTLVASVRVTQGGSPIRPAGISCAASFGGAKVKGGAKAASGLASCLFKTPKSAKGKAMTGSIAFRAGGTAFTKRFATTLG